MSGHRLLRHLIGEGDTIGISQLLRGSRKPDVNNVDGLGRTPIYSASEVGGIAVVQLLVNLGADVTRQDNDGWSPLHVSALHGHAQVAGLLLRGLKQGDIDATTISGATPLIIACRAGKDKCVRLLIRRGADVNVKDNDDLSPVHHAAIGGSSTVLQLLQEEGANLITTNLDGFTPLACAVQAGSQNVVKYLLQATKPTVHGHVKIKPIKQSAPIELTLPELARRCGYPQIADTITAIPVSIKHASSSPALLQHRINTEAIHESGYFGSYELDANAGAEISSATAIQHTPLPEYPSKKTISKQRSYPLELVGLAKQNPRKVQRSMSSKPLPELPSGVMTEQLSREYDRDIIGFMKSKKKLRYYAEVAVRKVGGVLKWPEQADRGLSFTYNPQDVGESHLIVEKAKLAFSEFYKQFDCITIIIDGAVIEKVTDLIRQRHIQYEDTEVNVGIKREQSQVRLVGHKANVASLHTALKEAEERLLDRKPDDIIQRRVQIYRTNVDLVHERDTLAKLRKRLPGLQLQLSGSDVLLLGRKQDVDAAYEDLYDYRKPIRKREIFPIGAGKCKLLRNDMFMDKFMSLSKVRNVEMKCHGDMLEIIGDTRQDIDKCLADINQFIKLSKIPFGTEAESYFGRKEWTNFTHDLHKEWTDIHVSISQNDICIVGFEANVEKSKNKIITFLETELIYEIEIDRTLSTAELLLFGAYFGDTIMEIQSKYASGKVKYRTDEHGHIFIESTKRYLERAKKAIVELVKPLFSKTIPILVPGLGRQLTTELGIGQLQNIAEKRHIYSRPISSTKFEKLPVEKIMNSLQPTTTTFSYGRHCINVRYGELAETECDAFLVITKQVKNRSILGSIGPTLVREGGDEVAREAATVLYKKRVVEVKTAGKLPAGCIIHVKPPGLQSTWKERMREVLQVAEDNKIDTIALCNFYSEKGPVSATTTATSLMEAVEDITNTNEPMKPKVISVIVGDPDSRIVDLYNDVYFSRKFIRKEQLEWTSAHLDALPRKSFQYCGNIEICAVNEQAFNQGYSDVLQLRNTSPCITRRIQWGHDKLHLNNDQIAIIKGLAALIDVSLQLTRTKTEAWIDIAGYKDDVVYAESVCSRILNDNMPF